MGGGQPRSPGLRGRELRRNRECRILEVLVDRSDEKVRVLGRARGVPAAHSELDRASIRSRGCRERRVLVATIGGIAGTGRESIALEPGRPDRGLCALAADARGKACALRIKAAETSLDAAAFVGTPARDHVDDAADCVGTVQRRARALDDFDALDEFRRDVLDGRGPDRPGVDAQAVHQHEDVIRLRAAHEKRCLLSRAAETCDFDARHESQRIAEIRCRLSNQLVSAEQVDSREDFPRGYFGARCGDDDGFECRVACGRGKQYQGVHPCSSRAVNRGFTGRGGNWEGRAVGPHPLSPTATGAC